MKSIFKTILACILTGIGLLTIFVVQALFACLPWLLVIIAVKYLFF